MEIPLRPPPPDVTSNFQDPIFLGLPVVVSASISLALVVIFACIRLYSKAVLLKEWRFDCCIYTLSCVLGIAMISFSFSVVLSGSNGYHAWDIKKKEVAKSSIVSLMAFWIALGPMLWLLKLALFSFILTCFGSVRWLKNCVWIGIIVTGLFFSTYTIVVTLTCGPRPGSDARSYVHGLNRKECSASFGTNAIVSNLTGVVDSISNVYILIISYPLVSTLPLTPKEMRGAYVMHLVGVLVCICSLLATVYRIKSWQTDDITGNQIPFFTSIVLETAFSLIIPCIPSVWTVFRHFTVPDINDTTTIATPNMKLLSSISSPQNVSRATWRKTHLSVEDLPYTKPSSEYSRPSHDPRDARMKALPATPLPLFTQSVPPSPTTPKTPRSPNSFRSMNLPIMFHTASSS